MSRYIDADALIVKMPTVMDMQDTYLPIHFKEWLIDTAPSIELEPKRGEWIDMGDFEQCSVCKGTHLKEFQSYYGKTTWVKTPYCPCCGADMRERKESE